MCEFAGLIAQHRQLERAQLGMTEQDTGADAVMRDRDGAAASANAIANVLRDDDAGLSDDAFAGGLDSDESDQKSSSNASVTALLRNVHVHATANITGDWTTDHVTAITAAITSAPANAISPYDTKLLLQHLADTTRTTATVWSKAQRAIIR